MQNQLMSTSKIDQLTIHQDIRRNFFLGKNFKEKNQFLTSTTSSHHPQTIEISPAKNPL